MTNILKPIGFALAGLVVGLLIASVNSSLVGGVYTQVNSTFREGIKVGTSNQTTISSSGVVTVGASGSAVTQLIKGTCNLTGMDVSQAASSTASYDCAVTGVVSGDLVLGSLGTTSQNTSVLNWGIAGVKASTTDGYITFRITNFSGAAAAPSITAVGSSTQYVIIR